MKLKIDENLPVEISELLQTHGHHAATVRDQEMTGVSDFALSQACKREKRILVTLDTDFGDLRKYPPEQHAGIVVLRLENQSARRVISVFQKVLRKMEEQSLAGRLWVVDEARIRIR